MFITTEMLKEKNPCEDQFETHVKLFPDGIETDDKKSMKVLAKAGLDTAWLARVFKLSGKFERHYDNGKRQYLCEYESGDIVREEQWWYKNGKRWYLCEHKDGSLVKERVWDRKGHELK